MSDESPAKKIAEANVFAFLASKNVSHSCPACQSTNVELDESGGIEAVIPYGIPIRPETSTDFVRMFPFPMAVLPVYVLKCNNCGHIRVFDRRLVDEAK